MTKEIIMSNSNRNAIVDEDDYNKVSHITWCLNSYGHVVSNKYIREGVYENISLHRVITNAAPGQIIDHKDGDKLNNTKDNLRKATVAENSRNVGINSRNTTGYKGVSAYRGRYHANIVFNGVNKYLGSYKKADDAAKAYNISAERLFGEFAWLNEVDHVGFKPSPKRKLTSKFKGVSLNKATGRWRARTVEGGKGKHLGTFDTEEEAAKAYKDYMTSAQEEGATR